MPGPEVLTRDDDIDVVGIFSALRRKWWVVVLFTLLCGAGLLLVLSMVSPRYESTARILVRDGNTTFTRATTDAGNQTGQPRFDEEAVRSEVEILRSNNLVFQVIDELQLTQLEEFKGDKNYAEIRNRVLELAGQSDRIEEPSRTPKEIEQRNKALKVFKDKLTVYAIEKSRVIVVDFWSNNPELAQLIVTRLSEKYIKLKKVSEIRDSETAAVWLDPRIKQLEQDVIKTEAAVAEFRANSDLLRADNNNALLATQQLSQVSTELSRLKAERSSAQAKVASIRAALKNGSSLDVIPEVIDSPLIQRLREREVALLAQVSDLSTTLLPNHPRLKALNSQLKDFQAQIRNAAENIVTSLENNVDLAQQAEADLEKEIIRLKAEAARVDEKLVELRALEREADAAKTLLLEYKSRALEVKSRSDLTQVDAEIISPATLPVKPYFPKILPFTFAGMVAAFVLSTLAVIAASLLTAVHSGAAVVINREEPMVTGADIKNDAEEDRGQEEARSAKSASRQSERIAPEPKETISANVFPVRFGAEAIRKMGKQRISVLSPGGDLGSITSCLLTRSLSHAGETVVLIDLAGGAVCTKKMLGSSKLQGIFDLISGAAEVEEILHQDRASSVMVVPAGSLFDEYGGTEIDLLPDYIDAIAESFDYCILDCGDADTEETTFVTEPDAVIVMSCTGATISEVDVLESDLHATGFKEVIRLQPDREDLDTERVAA